MEYLNLITLKNLLMRISIYKRSCTYLEGCSGAPGGLCSPKQQALPACQCSSCVNQGHAKPWLSCSAHSGVWAHSRDWVLPLGLTALRCAQHMCLLGIHTSVPHAGSGNAQTQFLTDHCSKHVWVRPYLGQPIHFRMPWSIHLPSGIH